jgi:hypothetical protein
MTTWVFSSACLFRELGDGGAVLVNEDTGQYYILNCSGRIVVNAVRNGWEIERIAELIQVTYQIAPDRARRDIEALTNEFVALGVLNPTETPSVPRT